MASRKMVLIAMGFLALGITMATVETTGIWGVGTVVSIVAGTIAIAVGDTVSYLSVRQG